MHKNLSTKLYKQLSAAIVFNQAVFNTVFSSLIVAVGIQPNIPAIFNIHNDAAILTAVGIQLQNSRRKIYDQSSLIAACIHHYSPTQYIYQSAISQYHSTTDRYYNTTDRYSITISFNHNIIQRENAVFTMSSAVAATPRSRT